MSTLSFAVSSDTLLDTPTQQGFETLINAQLAPLLSDLIKGVGFVADDEARTEKIFSTVINYDTGSTTTMANPYRVKTFLGRTANEVRDLAQAFFDANPGYFFTQVFVQLYSQSARRSRPFVGFLLYNPVYADGAANYAGSGAGGGGGGGGVTSVGLALPVSVFTVSGSPVTTSGTLTGSLNTQTANRVFAGPATGSPATPTFRALAAADIPPISPSGAAGGDLTGTYPNPIVGPQTTGTTISGPIPAATTPIYLAAIATYSDIEVELELIKGTTRYSTTLRANIADGVTPEWAEEGVVIAPPSGGTFDFTITCDISGGNLRVLVTPSTTGWSARLRQQALSV